MKNFNCFKKINFLNRIIAKNNLKKIKYNFKSIHKKFKIPNTKKKQQRYPITK